MNPSYIAENLEELFENSPDEIKELIESGEVGKTTAIIGKIYNIPINLYVALSNIISFILIGALNPEDVVKALEEILKVPKDVALQIAGDLEKSILEKARIKVLGKPKEGVVTLTLAEKGSDEDLRKKILDTTKREIEPTKEAKGEEEKPPLKKQVTLTPGSHAQLLEQLQVLNAIPNDAEVETRLNTIKEQIDSLDTKRDSSLSNNIALKEFMLGDKGDDIVSAETKTSSYSKAPTKYNIDPYRELPADE